MILKINRVSKNFGEVHALSSISLEIESGGVFGLIGSNGAGKSTLMKILATLERPSSGTVFLDDVDIQKHPNELKKVLGYLPQDVAVYQNLTAHEFLDYIAALKSVKGSDAKKQITNLMESFHLAMYNKRKLSDYSGGMRQRVGIAAALLGNPQVIVIDEPSVGLDPEERISLRNLLCDLAKTRIVLLSTHIISDIESTASRLAVMQKGHVLFCGTSNEFTKETAGSIEAAYLHTVQRGRLQ